MLKLGGVLVSTEGAADPVVAPSTVKGIPIFVTPKGSTQLQQIAELIDSGIIQPPSIETLLLKDAAQAHQAIQHEHRHSKLVLQVVL